MIKKILSPLCAAAAAAFTAGCTTPPPSPAAEGEVQINRVGDVHFMVVYPSNDPAKVEPLGRILITRAFARVAASGEIAVDQVWFAAHGSKHNSLQADFSGPPSKRFYAWQMYAACPPLRVGNVADAQDRTKPKYTSSEYATQNMLSLLEDVSEYTAPSSANPAIRQAAAKTATGVAMALCNGGMIPSAQRHILRTLDQN